MNPTVVAELLRQGLLGVLLAGAGVVIMKLFTLREADRVRHAAALEELQKLRLDDQKTHQQQQLELTRTVVAGIGTMTNAAAGQKEALAEVRATIKEQNDVVVDAIDKLQQLLQMHSTSRR